MFKTKEELVTVIKKYVPYPQHIDELDLDSEETAIRFRWRNGNYFRVCLSGVVESIDGGFFLDSDISILFEQVIKQGKIITTVNEHAILQRKFIDELKAMRNEIY